MNFKNFTDSELYLLRSTLRNADNALTHLFFKGSIDSRGIVDMIYCDNESEEETSVSLGELESLIHHVICALNDEEDRRVQEC